MTAVDIGGVDPGYDGGAPNAYGEGGNNFGDGGFMGINTGNKVMDLLIGGLFPGLSVIDRLAGFSWGDGVAGRGSSNNPTDQGASVNDQLEQIINTLTGRTPDRLVNKEPITADPRAKQEGSRPIGSGRSNIRLPNRGGSTLRRRSGGGSQYDPATGMESRDFLAPSAPSTPEMPNLSQLFADKLRGANNAAVDRSGGLMQLLNRGANRGDFAIDANTAAAVNPVLQQGRDQALSSMLSGSRVADNLFDLSNLRNDIGTRQGAQNINVRGRLPAMRSRRY